MTRTKLGISFEGTARALPRPFVYPYWEELVASLTFGISSPSTGEPLVAMRLECDLSPRLADFFDWLLPDSRERLTSGWCSRRASQ